MKLQPNQRIICNELTNGKGMIETKIKYDCECHVPGNAIMHFMACCHDGYQYTRKLVKNEDGRDGLISDLRMLVPKKYNR